MQLARHLAARAQAIISALALIALIAMTSLASAATSVLTPSPVSWDFGSIDIHGSSPMQTFTFTNNTAGSVAVASASIVGPNATAYRVSSDGCSNSFLPTSAQCSVQVMFVPTATGPQAASLEIADSSGTLDVPLAGTGITGTLSASPNPVTFSAQPWFYGGQQQSITIQDSNAAGVQATTAVITGPDASRFSIGWGQNCGTQEYVPGTMCGMGINFNPPNGPGTFSAQLEITSDSLSSPLIIPLSATALSGPHVVVTPPETNFGDVAIGSSVARTVTVSNDGDYPMQVQGTLLITGAPSELPVTADGCSGQVISVGAACQFTVTYRPSAARELNADVLLLTNGQGAPTPAGFTGDGVPTINGTVVLSGRPAAGSTLTCAPAGYPSGTVVVYRWMRNGRLIATLRAPRLTLRDADIGARFACQIVAANSVSTQTVTSSQTAVVMPMSLVGEPGAFTDAATCRRVQTAHLVRLGGRDVVVRYGAPVTPWAPLRFTSARVLSAHIDGRLVGHGRVVTISPQTLWSFANGARELTVADTGASAQGHLVLGACAFAARLDGGPSKQTTISASSRYGVRSLSFRLPSHLRLAAGVGRTLGWVTVTTAGVPSREFSLIGPRTESNAVTVSLSTHLLTVTNLPARTGVVSVTLRPGVVVGQPGVVTATAHERGSGTLLRASTPATWLP
jgi:hypothetical protein